MGMCWCKKKNEIDEWSHCQSMRTRSCENISTPVPSLPYMPQIHNGNSTALVKHITAPDAVLVDRLVLDTLGIMETLVDNEQEPPSAMLQLHNIADNEDGWIQVVQSMINVIPLSDPLGPSVITLLLDDCPLPSKESIIKVVNMFSLSRQTAINDRKNPTKQRNTCIVLSSIAEKLGGPRNVELLTDGLLDYLSANLELESNPYVILFSLIALEKFAQHNENKTIILNKLKQQQPSPILVLEKWKNDTNYIKRQVGFCAQWILDNIFLYENRNYSYLSTNMENINAMLNTSDVSEYLKISPDGLEARCDAYSFESVRCTAEADFGVWYYEVLIITPGVMQIGWATKNSNFLNHEGYGIGDDRYSLSYDGCRRLIWYNAKSDTQTLPRWQSGDILGCLLDLDNQQIIFSVNGISLQPSIHVFSMAKSGFYAAASFMSFQQCRFNFGSQPFKYPPNIAYKTFNDHGNLKAEEKIVLPRHIYFNQLRQQNVGEDSCTLCYDKKASVRLLPCEHSGFCPSCAALLTECPMCRAPFRILHLEDNPQL